LAVFVLACVTWPMTSAVTNLLRNPSFEDDPSVDWVTNGFTIKRYTADVVDGSYSIKCTGRSAYVV
jgi:hypothetical protein